MAKHTVKAGEHLARIAHEAGHTNYRHVFDLGDNSNLKSDRKTPHILSPGDEVVLPEPEPRYDDAETEKRHTYKVRWSKLKLRLVLRDLSDKPLKDQKCVVDVENLPASLTTDKDGKLERDIPHDAGSGRLVARDDSIGFEVDAPMVLGGLRPVDSVEGQLARLNNLGYFAGDPDAPPDAAKTPEARRAAELAFRSAVEEFQCDHGLSVDGKCGPNTQAKLKEVHGC